jgi:hypothetical protein
MFLDDNDKVSTDDLTSKGQTLTTLYKGITDAVNETYIKTKDTLGVFDKFVEKITAAQNLSVGLQRSMGGAFGQMGKDATAVAEKFESGFLKRLTDSLSETQKFGGSLTDIKDVIEGLADNMGRAVNPSKEVIVNMVALSKTTGLTNKEVGGMVEGLTSLGGTQLEATESMSIMAQTARKAGLDATKFVKEIGTNLEKTAGFGFNDKAVESLTRMTKQAQMLKTTMSSIVGTLQDTVLSPEGAIDAAAKFQMLGGAVGKLADPFQLMYMAQSDMEGLQKELVKSTQAAFSFNKETGEFKASTQDLYRLKEQASITGAKFEDLVKQGREAAKLDYIKDKFNLDGLSEDNKELLSGLAQVGKDGAVTIDIPGYGEVTEASIKSGDAAKALEEYQKTAALDEKQIAINQLTVTENQAKAVEIIKNSVLVGLTEDKQKELLNTLRDNNAAYADATSELATAAGNKIAEGVVGTVDNIGDQALKQFGDVTGYGPKGDPTLAKQAKTIEAIGNLGDLTKMLEKVTEPGGSVVPSNDLFVPSGGKPRVLAQGKIYEGIVGDEVVMGTNLSDALNKGGGGISGKIDININLSGSVGGDPGQLSNMFNSPQVQKQIMDTVLYKLNEYKRQQGVLS